MKKGAIFSNDRKYRYALWRTWDDELPEVLFIGLNPSNANEKKDDPTMIRVIGFARDWGYGGVVMMNLFGLVSSKPKVLTQYDDPVGPDNDLWLNYQVERKCDVIFAWGAFKHAKKRAETVAKMFQHPKCLGFNKDGSPKHPLFLPANIKPMPYVVYSVKVGRYGLVLI